ncbi:putative transposase, partial [Aneurinibacillus soli]
KKMNEKQIDIQEARKAMNTTKDKRMFERYQTVYLHLCGKKNKDIAQLLGRTPQTICTYLKLYRKNGLAGLELRHSPGAPKRLTEEQEQQVAEVVATKRPIDVDVPVEYNWTAGLIGKWIEREYGVSYTLKGVTILLKRLGFSYTKASYTLAKADPEKQEAFRETFTGIKKTSEWRN